MLVAHVGAIAASNARCRLLSHGDARLALIAVAGLWATSRVWSHTSWERKVRCVYSRVRSSSSSSRLPEGVSSPLGAAALRETRAPPAQEPAAARAEPAPAAAARTGPLAAPAPSPEAARA